MAKPRFATQKRVSLKGSERKAFEAAQTKDFPAKPHDESQPITVSVLLARKAAIDPTVRLTREDAWHLSLRCLIA